MSNSNAEFNAKNVQVVDLKLLNGQVNIILRSLELYAYNLDYMLNNETVTDDERQEKKAMIRYTYEQVLATQAEQVNGKVDNSENLSQFAKNMTKDDNIINLIPANKELNIG